MVLTGHVQNGVVVLDGGSTLPEGARVQVMPTTGEVIPIPFPLFPSKAPGQLNLTGDRIAEILSDDDVPS